MRHTRLLIGLSLCALACTGGVESQAGKGGKPAADAAASGVAATIGSRQITLAEVDQKAKATNMQVFQQLYDARKTALDEIVRDHLLELEAKDRGISKDALLDTEVAQKTPAVTDAEVEAFYNQNKARLQGQTLEQSGPQIRQYLTAQRRDGALGTLISGLEKKHAVKVSLDVPRAEVTIAANDPIKGPASADVTIVEFSDFQ